MESGCSSKHQGSRNLNSVELGQTWVTLSFGPALRPNSSRAVLKALGQENWALQ